MGALANRDFRRLWLADLVSQFGSRVDVLAVPLLAVTALGASVFEVSLLRTAESLPYLVLGLQVGAWCDRMRHRPVLIAADVGRAVLIASIPVAALFGVLGLAHLLVVVLGVGLLGVFFDIAHQTYVPRLVTREQLPDANSRLQTNLSMAAVAGPGLAGLVVQALGNAAALAVDAVSYLWSALWLRRIETPDVRPEPRLIGTMTLTGALTSGLVARRIGGARGTPGHGGAVRLGLPAPPLQGAGWRSRAPWSPGYPHAGLRRRSARQRPRRRASWRRPRSCSGRRCGGCGT